MYEFVDYSLEESELDLMKFFLRTFILEDYSDRKGYINARTEYR